jgi:UDP-N-acetylglucosamine 1-carboxyvinyltransferase
MSKIVVRGGGRLEGSVRIEPSKNAILPILAASLLAETPVVFREVPWLDDVDTLVRLLAQMGAVCTRHPGGALTVAVGPRLEPVAPYHLASRMRASFLVAGPLLARFGRARIPLPGGCAIGSRPIDLHLRGFEALGAKVSTHGGEVLIEADGLHGADIVLDYPSVGATENVLAAATRADGETRIANAAREPEVVDLARFLVAMGAEVEGAGSDEIRVRGVSRLAGTEFAVIPDRIEAGTFLAAAAITGGDVTVLHARPEHLRPVLAKLAEAGAEVEVRQDRIRLRRRGRLRAVDITTLPYPGFPTDMQAPMMAVLTLADGVSVIRETVFENRFRHADELCRMGARIRVEGRCAFVTGVDELVGAPVQATDLRAAAALVLAGLAAHGLTEILDAEHLDRGYHHLERKLGFLGADIERVEAFAEML